MGEITNSMNTDQVSELTVYFDGSCPLCTLEIDHYKRQSGAQKLCFVDASSSPDLGSDLPRETALGRFHVRSEWSTPLGRAWFRGDLVHFATLAMGGTARRPACGDTSP